MAQLNLTMTVTQCWYARPLFYAIVILGWVGVIKDEARASKWYVDRALKFDVT